MTQRLVQVHTSAAVAERVREALRAAEPAFSVEQALGDERVRFEALVAVGSEQGLLDRLQGVVGGDPSGQILVLGVEAAVPPVTVLGTPPKGRKRHERPGRISREELYDDVLAAAQLSPSYVATVLLSVVVVSIGLVRSSPAVVIGGMVIAPLLGPHIGLGLAATLADRALAGLALRTSVVGLLLALAVSLVVGWTIGVRLDDAGQIWSPEIRTRTEPRDVDLVLALAAGIAGTMAFTTRAVSSLVGVMVAVALMPPLVVAGMCAAAGLWQPAQGALLLLAANVVCVNLAAVLTLLAQAISPRHWWDVRRSRRVVRVVVLSLFIALALLAFATIRTQP